MAYNYEYPYTDISRVNSDWILKRIVELCKEFDEFVIKNKIKYHDPIQWDITTQYEQYEVVTNENKAYMSKEPIPKGTPITSNKWLLIADFGALYDSIKLSICAEDDKDSPTTTKDREKNSWVWLSDKLYNLTRDIASGDAYVKDGSNPNVVEITVEEQIAYYVAKLTQAIVDETNERISADTLIEADVDVLSGKIDTIELWKNNIDIINVRDYGAVGDGTTDDTDAFKSAIADLIGSSVWCKTMYIPVGLYLITDTLELDTPIGCTIIGDGVASMIKNESHGFAFEINDSNRLTFANFRILGQDTGNGILFKGDGRQNQVRCNNVVIENTYSYGIKFDSPSGYCFFSDCRFTSQVNNKCEYIAIGKDYVWSSGLVFPNYIYVNHCSFEGMWNTESIGASIYAGQYIFFDGCDFANLKIGLYCKPNTNCYINDIYLNNSVLFNASQSGIELVRDDNTTTQMYDINISNCSLTNTVANNAKFLNSSNSTYSIDNVAFSNCVISASTPTGYIIDGEHLLHTSGINTLRPRNGFNRPYDYVKDVDDNYKRMAQKRVTKTIASGATASFSFNLIHDWLAPSHYVPVLACTVDHDMTDINYVCTYDDSAGTYTVTVTNNTAGARTVIVTLV